MGVSDGNEFMKKVILILLFAALSVYSVGMIAIDVFKGRDVARGFFSDIVAGQDYPLPAKALYGLNTSLCVTLLAGTALLYAVSVAAPSGKRTPRDLCFQVAQVFFFVYLAADDRLRIHELVGYTIGIEDAFLLLGLGVLEVAMLFFLGRVHHWPWRVKGWLVAAGGLFFVMVVIDAFFPKEMKGRLALEDLAKLWAIVFLFLHAWNYCLARIAGDDLTKGVANA